MVFGHFYEDDFADPMLMLKIEKLTSMKQNN